MAALAVGRAFGGDGGTSPRKVTSLTVAWIDREHVVITSLIPVKIVTLDSDGAVELYAK